MGKEQYVLLSHAFFYQALSLISSMIKFQCTEDGETICLHLQKDSPPSHHVTLVGNDWQQCQRIPLVYCSVWQYFWFHKIHYIWQNNVVNHVGLCSRWIAILIWFQWRTPSLCKAVHMNQGDLLPLSLTTQNIFLGCCFCAFFCLVSLLQLHTISRVSYITAHLIYLFTNLHQ